jgi:C4-dicarboxylate-specific signal transduction histidine kinase
MGSAAAWWVAAKTTQPIIALSNSAKQIANGRLDGVISVRAHGELADLTASFNTMTAELRHRTEMQQQTQAELLLQTELLEGEVAQRQMAQEALTVKQYQLEALNLTLEERINSALEELRIKDRIMLTQGRQAAMGEMINNIAHQWRQPLNNLGLIVQNIQVDHECGSMTTETLATDVNKVMDTIIFMSQTINDFRSFFSPDCVKKVFTIYQSLTNVITMVEASLSKQGVQLLIEQQQDGISVEGYCNEYNQVLLNILNNAKDALLEQSAVKPAILVSIGSENDLAVVRIADNAGGIPDDIIGKVFDPYFTTKENGKGSGIGLYISRTIIEEHFGGTLTVANVDGGAQFTITVPQVHAET